MSENAHNHSAAEKVGHPSIVIAWDPEVLSEQEYAQIVAAIADMIRAEGGIGIQRLGTYHLSLSGIGVYV